MSEGRSFLQILRERAASTAERPAYQIVGEGGSVGLTWGDVAQRVQALGEALYRAGHGSGRTVALCMENRPAWSVAYLGTWYGGATVVPIDPALEAHAIRRILQHSGATACLTSNSLSAKLAAACEGLSPPPELLNVDGGGHRRWDGTDEGNGVPIAVAEGHGLAWDEFVTRQGRGSEAWEPHAAAGAIGTIMYTSGTTGTPKGVMLTREALLENIRAGLERIDLTADDHVLGVLPLFHALPLMATCLGPLFIGARVTFLAELNPDKIIAAFRDHRITAFACVPLFYYRFHDRVMKKLAALPGRRRRIAFMLLRANRFLRRRLGINLGRRLFAAAHEPFGDDLRLFVTGGAKFNANVYEDFLDLGFPLVQGYGLTEGAAILAAHSLEQLRADTVGKPVDGVEIRIEAPGDDGVGEILARTPSRMLGYYRNDEATAEVFDGDWLRTGDLGRLLPDGSLQVTGRAKDMIVLASGKNIYPEEIEAFYGQAEVVDEICILGIEDPTRQGAERLHAIVVPDMEVLRKRGQVNVREMVKWELESLGLELSGPQRVTSLELRSDPLPRTTTRKLKRFELKREILERGRVEPDSVTAPRAEETVEDRTDEPAWVHDLRAIVARHARLEGVLRTHHLDLDLGLESLDRIELQAEIEAAFDVEFPAAAAGSVQTVGDLIDLVEAQGTGRTARSDAGTDRWERVLTDTPPGVDAYLQPHPFADAFIRPVFAFLRVALRLVGYRVSGLERLPDDYPFIIAPNHFSYLDPFLLAMALPRRIWDRVFFVGYSEYFEGRLLGFLSSRLRTIPIDPNRNLEHAMQAAAEGLRRGMVLVIFPEGARSSDGTVKQFRRGSSILARLLGVPIVPVGLWGTYEMWPREGHIRPHKIGIRFGESRRLPETATRDDEGPFMDALREQVIALVGEAEALYGKKK